MNVPLKIDINDNQEQTVSGRELHAFLEIETRYDTWFGRMLQYGFVEGVDFNLLKKERVQHEGDRDVKREIIDHILKLDMAKELCMLARNEKGKQARQYFLQVEREWNSPEKVMARALMLANKRLAETSKQLEAAKPKIVFADAVSASPTTILVSDLAKLIKQNGYPIGEKRLFKWLRDNGYLIKRKCADYNSPTQRSMEMGLFEKKMTAITHSDGRVTTSCTSRVTGKGQQYFVNKFVALKGGVAQ